MKQNLTRILVVLDRSGSMETVHEATVSGLNEFIASQKETPGDATIRIVQFDDNQGKLAYDVITDQNLKDAKPITNEQFQPRGMTPLYDAMGRAINELGAELSALSENERPDKVLVCIVTDGEENASKEFIVRKREELLAGKKPADIIRAMVEHQTTKYNWQFTYVGANQDAVLVGNTLGVDALRCMSFTSDDEHTKTVFRGMSAYASRVRGASASTLSKVGYSDEERAASVNDKLGKNPRKSRA